MMLLARIFMGVSPVHDWTLCMCATMCVCARACVCVTMCVRVKVCVHVSQRKKKEQITSADCSLLFPLASIVHACARLCVCVLVHVCVSACMCVCLRACVRRAARAFPCVCFACAHVCVHLCVRAGACVHEHACACVRLSLHAVRVRPGPTCDVEAVGALAPHLPGVVPPAARPPVEVVAPPPLTRGRASSTEAH